MFIYVCVCVYVMSDRVIMDHGCVMLMFIYMCICISLYDRIMIDLWIYM